MSGRATLFEAFCCDLWIQFFCPHTAIAWSLFSTEKAVIIPPELGFLIEWGFSWRYLLKYLIFVPTRFYLEVNWDQFVAILNPFCLRPSAKDQGITWVVVVLVVVHHLVHFLLKINLSETWVLLHLSQALYQLCNGKIVTKCRKITYLT